MINTELENSFFDEFWSIYLKLIEKVAFSQLNFRKIFIYAFDLRKKLYKVLAKNNYIKEAQLKDHYLHDNKFIDVLIYSKII